MQKRYTIGFFAVLFFVLLLLGVGYQVSYQHVMDKQDARIEKEEENFISTKGNATKNDGYYLKELHGYVAVYYQDGTTLYELTEIPFTSLPEEVKGAVKRGKYVKSTRELYGFLENYSS